MPNVDRGAASFRRVGLRVLLVLLLTVAAIYWLVRAFDLDVDQLLRYLFASGLLVLLSALTGLLIVVVLKLLQRLYGKASKNRSRRGA